MSKSSLERLVRSSIDDDEAGDQALRHRRSSDASSLASLDDDVFGDGLHVSGLHIDDGGSALDPKRWAWRKKMFVAVVIAIYTCVFYSGSSVFMICIPGVMGKYGVGQEHALMGLSLFVLGYGLGPLLWAPLTEVRWMGRNPVYIFTIVAFVGICFLTATTALQNLPVFLFLRFLQGFFGSPCLANGGASMHDMFDEQDLPYALGIWIAFAYAGPALGPALAAYPTEWHGWQFPMWSLAFASIPVCILLCLIPETYLPKILYRSGSYARLAPPRDLGEDGRASVHDSVLATLKDSLIKPVEISMLDPSVNFVNIYTSFCYATYYTFFDALPITYISKYGFTLTEVAVACSCIMLGCAFGAGAYFAYVYYVGNPAAARGGTAQEDRLKPALVAVCLIPVGICIFAFASNGEIHWLVGMSGITIYSGAVFVILQCLSMYMLKSYPDYAASLFASNDACRSVLAAGAVHVGLPFYSNLGIVNGCGLLAAISVLGIVGMFLLYWKGASLRARSKFAVK